MKNLKLFLTKHPILSVICLTIIWFALGILFMGISSSILKREFGDTITVIIGLFVALAFILWLTWQLDWLKAAGITGLGNYKVWLLALAGIIYFVPASLYSFFGNLSFQFSNLINLDVSGSVIIRNIFVCVGEEVFFRGTVLFILVRVWGNTKKGLIGSVLLMSLIFAFMHATATFSSGLSGTSLLLLITEAFIISIWWGALVLNGRSIWPAFMAHYAVNTVVALQASSVSFIEPKTETYTRILLFSIPLGISGIWLLLQTFKRQTVQ